MTPNETLRAKALAGVSTEGPTSVELLVDYVRLDVLDNQDGASKIGYGTSNVATTLNNIVVDATTQTTSINSLFNTTEDIQDTLTQVTTKLDDFVSVKDFGAKGDGITDDTIAIQAALTNMAGRRLFFPAGTYKLTAPTSGDGTQVVEYDQGVTIAGTNGGGVYNVTRIDYAEGIMHHNRAGLPGAGYSTVGQLFRSTNKGTTGGYGQRINYVQEGISTSGFSIGHGVVANLKGVSGSQGLASWLVAVSPSDATRSFGVYCQEVNVINRAGDSGYSKRRGTLTQWTGGIQAIPEAVDLTGEVGDACYNVTYGFAVTRSGDNKADGKPAKTYNGLLIEQDAIGPNGRGVLASGDTTAVAIDRPEAGLEVDQRWKFGIKTRDGIFDQGRAILMGNNQWIAMENASGATGFKILGVSVSDAVVIAAAKAGGGITFVGTAGTGASPSGKSSYHVLTDANAVSYLQTAPGIAGNTAPVLSAQGDDANINITIKPKGTGIPIMLGLREYADDTAAAAGGIPKDGLYRTGSIMKVRVV